jgi:hypothetical protein
VSAVVAVGKARFPPNGLSVHNIEVGFGNFDKVFEVMSSIGSYFMLQGPLPPQTPHKIALWKSGLAGWLWVVRHRDGLAGQRLRCSMIVSGALLLPPVANPGSPGSKHRKVTE